MSRWSNTTEERESFSTATEFPTASDGDADLPILVVGGTDGSGTRVVVQVLQLLGVPFCVDDRESLDVHASKMGGWPMVLSRILRKTKPKQTWKQRLESMDTQTAYSTKQSLSSLMHAYEERTKPLLDSAKYFHKPLPTNVLYGFKAPSTLLLHSLIPTNVRFLHVVRDGRDIALSSNQSPVEKFYQDYYQQADDTRDSIHRSLRLWNDWNYRQSAWSIRIEDLVIHETSRVVQQLAEWVGSPRTSLEVCCIVKHLQENVFIDAIRAHYGKWKSNAEVTKAASQDASTTLRLWGYEPWKSFLKRNREVSQTETECVCTRNLPRTMTM